MGGAFGDADWDEDEWVVNDGWPGGAAATAACVVWHGPVPVGASPGVLRRRPPPSPPPAPRSTAPGTPRPLLPTGLFSQGLADAAAAANAAFEADRLQVCVQRRVYGGACACPCLQCRPPALLAIRPLCLVSTAWFRQSLLSPLSTALVSYWRLQLFSPFCPSQCSPTAHVWTYTPPCPRPPPPPPWPPPPPPRACSLWTRPPVATATRMGTVGRCG